MAGAFGLGSVTQYVASISKASGGVSGLVSALGLMRNNAAFLRLTFDFLDIPNHMYQGSLTVEKRNDRKYQVEFRKTTFINCSAACTIPRREKFCSMGLISASTTIGNT